MDRRPSATVLAIAGMLIGAGLLIVAAASDDPPPTVVASSDAVDASTGSVPGP